MPQPTQTLFYVANLAASNAFYADLFELQPSVASPFYAMFKLKSGFEFALYDPAKLQAGAAPKSAAAELGFVVADLNVLHALYLAWKAKGIQIIMEPTKMYSGGTHFMGLDLDGHRLRVGTPD